MRLSQLAMCVAAAAPFGAHATDGYFSHGYGMKAKGMGGASIAMTQDAFGGANNPSTMVFADDQFAIGADLFSPRRSAERTGGAAFRLDGSADSGSRYFVIPELAYNKMVRPDLSLGVTVYGNGGMNTDYPGGHPDGCIGGGSPRPGRRTRRPSNTRSGRGRTAAVCPGGTG